MSFRRSRNPTCDISGWVPACAGTTPRVFGLLLLGHAEQVEMPVRLDLEPGDLVADGGEEVAVGDVRRRAVAGEDLLHLVIGGFAGGLIGLAAALVEQRIEVRV